ALGPAAGCAPGPAPVCPRGPRPPGSRRPGGCSSSGSSPCRSGDPCCSCRRRGRPRARRPDRSPRRRRGPAVPRLRGASRARGLPPEGGRASGPWRGVSYPRQATLGMRRFLMASSSKSAAVRARLQHPVIDGDGHWLEPLPIFLDYLKDVAGQSVVDKFVKRAKDVTWYDLTPQERRGRRLPPPPGWGEPANTLDRATAMIPRLFYERLDDIGLDFCVLYTSLGLFYVSNPDAEIRQAVSRAVNRMNAEMFRPYAHRITPAAVVPMHTPQEAIEEATYAVRELGLKVLMIANHVRRPVPAFMRDGAEPNEMRTYVDSLAFESAHDYDPFWQRCVDLKTAVTAHSGSMGTNWRESVWSFTYNPIGHFANASHAFAKALILGGVTHRFPQLRWAMLEGGVGWACNLVTALVGHWERRRREAMESQTRPTNLDQAQLRALFREDGGPVSEEKIGAICAGG